jgi:dTDP-4-dehydrorhamnose 3,5-epimerase
MTIDEIPTELDGPKLLAPKAFGDERGFFMETFRENVFAERFGIAERWVQDNHSRSQYGVIRGMHFTIGDGAAKLVRCGRGAIVDVLVDIRKGSPTYGKWEAFELSDENLRVLYAPRGFAHGFCVVSELADVLYKQSAYYSTDVERGIKLDDPDVAIEWPVPAADQILSQRDLDAPTLRAFEADNPF